MKVSLFLEDRIHVFYLPNQISGSYSFDMDEDEEDKLINIEARNNKWVLYSTDLSLIKNNDTVIPAIDISDNSFYVISKNNINYLIYVSSSRSNIVKSFIYDENSIIRIGNDNESTIVYNSPYLNGLYVELKKVNGVVTLVSNLKMYFYIDDVRVLSEQMVVKYGSIINVLGLKVTVLPNMLVFSFPNQMVSIRNANIREFVIEAEEYQNINVKDIDLYNKNNYFSKSPRIRRLIETKEVKLDRPPKLRETEKMPLILTLGPMLSLMASSGITLLNTVIRISEGTTTFKQSWTSFATCGVMLTTSFLWPMISRAYNKKQERKNNEEVVTKYTAYLKQKEQELEEEIILQKSILNENLIPCTECLEIINLRKNNFWSKRKEQNDFLEVKIGMGRVPLAVKLSFPEDGFTLEEDNLKKMADKLVENTKDLNNVPLGYSFYENYLTAVMGPDDMCAPFVNNVILQLMTFYCYDELKFIVFTSEKNSKNWEYLKYSNYNFSNNRKIRYYDTNNEEYKNLSEYLHQELQYRLEVSRNNQSSGKNFKQYYIIICDNYTEAKKLDFFKELVEVNSNVGYSAIFLDNSLSNLPSKCVNFITLNKGVSGVLKNSFESAHVTEFHDEIQYGIDMMNVVKVLSNVPVEILDEEAQLPNSISFLEMEKVGKVEQLNILNRWNSNDSTKSLKAEVGVSIDDELMYLDLHEKFHGPHGLIAGMTGSGKSEFIITYILSMAMNYSPDDVSFVLIDYKGGGLAGAFLNEVTGIRLPHLAGTITNLDKSEMNRTLVSIDSEIKRRQAMFNDARDKLGESTIDIYKYQDFYHSKKISEPIPHLFIICDEFAELKSQQPEFMDNLISVARIGRSLGVHLILATQKPSGVVNDQIWSNSKFRVCLKVQDTSDSNEMIKKPDAANIKQTGRFYLQVGYDEYFALGQSAWCGAKYYPSDKVAKTVDKSINFIDGIGMVVKSIEDDKNKNVNAQGEQIASIMNEIINVSKQTNKVSRMLWLENIPDIILVDDIRKKYNITTSPYNVEAIIGEYDAPELQSQGVVKYNLLTDGNTIIYGVDGTEKEMLLQSMIYSIASSHTPEEVNMYALDFGSESMRIFNGLPHLGGIVTAGDEERYNNLINLIREEKRKRKELFINYGGEYINYIKNSNQKLPIWLVIINNFDAAKSSLQSLYEELPDLVRDSDRYGIVYVMTANGGSSIGQKISQNCNNTYCLRLKDTYEYSSLLGLKVKIGPKEAVGRGMCSVNGAHEFQVASIVKEADKLSDYIMKFVNQTKSNATSKAKRIPALPTRVMLDDVSEAIKGISTVPVGIEKNTLEIVSLNLIENIGNLVLSNKLDNTKGFVFSLIDIFNSIKNTSVILVDSNKGLNSLSKKVTNYYDDNFDAVLDSLITFVNNITANPVANNYIIMINGLNRFASKISDTKKLEELFKNLKKLEKVPVIAIDEAVKIKQNTFDSWYRTIFTGQEGLWIGSGVSEQQVLKVSSYNKEFRANYKNDMGFYVSNGDASLVKLIDFSGEGAGN